MSLPPPGTAQLLLKQEGTTPTSVQEVDARGALTRGLREYLSQLQWEAPAGRKMQFQKVRDNWAEPEESAKYPAAAVYTVGTGTYEASGLTPSVTSACQLPAPDGRYVVTPAMLNQELTLEVWANDPKERVALCAMLEDALNPVIYRYGFQLRLPFYFNEIATYALAGISVNDSDENALRRYRLATLTITGNVPVMKLVSLPLARPKFVLQDIGSDSDVLVQTEVT